MSFSGTDPKIPSNISPPSFSAGFPFPRGGGMIGIALYISGYAAVREGYFQGHRDVWQLGQFHKCTLEDRVVVLEDVLIAANHVVP